MIQKIIQKNLRIGLISNYKFAIPPKKRTQAPKYLRADNKDKIALKDIDYSKIPQKYRKGVKAYNQAVNLAVTSQAQLEAVSLKAIIIQQREKFFQSLQSVGIQSVKTKQQAKPTKQQTKPTKQQTTTTKETLQTKSTNSTVKQQKNEKQQTKVITQKYYDLFSALKFTSVMSTGLLGVNLLGYGMFNILEYYSYLGMFLGFCLKPTIVTVIGSNIGFNLAVWIIKHSLHLHITNQSNLTIENISLTKSSSLMYVQALMIAGQSFTLGSYMLYTNINNPISNINYLIAALIISQSHLIWNIVKTTKVAKFPYYSKFMITNIVILFFLVMLMSRLFQNIQGVKPSSEIKFISEEQALQYLKNVQLKNGYQQFLDQFRSKKIEVNAGQTINKLTSQEAL